jgi:hypothetical protein
MIFDKSAKQVEEEAKKKQEDEEWIKQELIRQEECSHIVCSFLITADGRKYQCAKTSWGRYDHNTSPCHFKICPEYQVWKKLSNS